MNYRIKWLSGICYASMMLGLVTSCADGVADNERFSAGAGVTNAQLEAPKLDLENFKVQTAGDGSQSVDVSWPVVYGAGGYVANVSIVNDPTNPIAVVKDSVIDGCHFSFKREIDTKYEVSVGTLSNEKLNNKGSLEPSVIAYSTMLPATAIPVGVEISQFIAENIPAGSTDEIAFELTPGETYQLTAKADMKYANVTIRGDRYNRPLVVVTGEGEFVTQGGLNLRYINFDMSDAPTTTLIRLSPDANPALSTEALGFKALSSSVKDGYVVMNPISIESCYIRNLPSCIVWTGDWAADAPMWSLNNLRISDCIVQLKKVNDKAVISLEGSTLSVIKTMSVSNSTFYNNGDPNVKARFIRYGTRTDPTRVFGPGATTEHLLKNVTFYKTFPAQQFANNMDNSKLTLTIEGVIFYDINRMDQYCFRSGTSYIANPDDNVSWLAGTEAKIHSNVLKISTELDPDFVGPTANDLDIDNPKASVNFRPQAPLCVEKKIGDPRWFE